MRLVVVLLAACAHRAPIADEWAPPGDAPEYPLAPTLLAASGGPLIVEGVVVPYSRGITLRTALALAGAASHSGTLVRGERTYELPVAAIVEHQMPDLQLAPGDVIVLRHELCTSMSDQCD